MPHDTRALFTPFSCGKLQLPNRIVMAPMTRNFADNWLPTEALGTYYRRRAEGGVGLVICGGATINHKASNGFDRVPRFYGEEALTRWEAIVEAVHQAGGCFAPQIWHVGERRRPGVGPDPSEPGVGPMDIYENGKHVVRALEKSEIVEIVSAYAAAARDAEAIGCDAVELHGAHGFLIDQFLWHHTNQRTDEYGGSLENRLKFAVEVVSSVRQAVSKDFPIICRLSQWKVFDYSAHIARNRQELAIILKALVAAGVDIFHVSTRRFWEPAFKDGPETLAALVRKLSGKPVIAVGCIGLSRPFSKDQRGQFLEAGVESDMNRLIRALDSRDFDLCAIGRALIADPDWPHKVRQGSYSLLKPFSAELLTELY
ncbi:12-oxophytodienoate reductase [Endozoicomonas atrinae]|uniref:oxidoreductase n=1 Tax=Endozoicomonas atrinae TaxID=1333660 RepID=UPI000826758D|nr:12-oxophytodienoate reductase [Endozoicomonas atrinae]